MHKTFPRNLIFSCKTPIILTFLISFALVFGRNAFAYNISTTLDIDPNTVKSGHILSLVGDSFVLSSEPYSPNYYGVIIENPDLALEGQDVTNPTFVSTIGNVPVFVSGENGPIVEGNFITTSSKDGIGMKATQPGNVLGRALEPADLQNADDQTQILVALSSGEISIPSTHRSNLIGMLQKGVKGTAISPLDSLRYFLAAVMILVTLFSGIKYFGKIAMSSVEAVGRNPLARGYITAESIISFILTAFVISIGLGISYLILVI